MEEDRRPDINDSEPSNAKVYDWDGVMQVKNVSTLLGDGRTYVDI